MNPSQTRAVLISSGVFLIIAAIGGVILLLLTGSDVESLEQPIVSDIKRLASQTPQPTNTIAPTQTEEPTLTATNTEQVDETQDGTMEQISDVMPPTQTPSATPVVAITPGPTPTPVIIEWTEEEKNALSWMCNDEIGGMGADIIRDACLSVISTVRARYAYPNGFTEKDVIGTLTRPNQFSIEVNADTPNARFYPIVEEYQEGARGSCSGYLFFDSVPGGPSVCVIYGVAGQFMEFHTGW